MPALAQQINYLAHRFQNHLLNMASASVKDELSPVIHARHSLDNITGLDSARSPSTLRAVVMRQAV